MFEKVAQSYGIAGAKLRPDLFISGSPERCIERAVVQGEGGQCFVVEHLFPTQGDNRIRVAKAMDMLAQGGISEVPSFLQKDGEYVVHNNGADWMVQPFVPGDPLPQPDYIDDSARGESLASFLVRINAFSSKVEGLDASFDLPKYIRDLLKAMKENRPDAVAPFVEVAQGLHGLEEEWDDMPLALAHGDYHPLNVMWQGMQVKAVIDWEFCGLRPELYDAANLIGCIGIEDPSMLGKGLAGAFLQGLREGGVLTERNGKWLHSLVLGLRFAWLSEWLRRNDKEMLELEARYMLLLLDNREKIEQAWGIR